MATALDDSWEQADDTVDGLQTADVLRAFGYRPDTAGFAAVLDSGELCTRCGKKVYPVERLDVGAIYHRGCFKCRVCQLRLTLKTFQRESDVGSGRTKEVYCSVHVPRQAGGGLDGDAMAIKAAVDAQKRQSQWLRKSAVDAGHSFEPNDLGYENSPWRQDQKRKSQRKPAFASVEDFEKRGVFDAQVTLERSHRREEDALYRQIFEARDAHVRALEQRIAAEKRRTVAALVAWFEQEGWGGREREAGMVQVETYFKNYKLQKLQALLRHLAAEEEAAAARMIEKHSQEMLMLISGKEEEHQDSSARYDDEVLAIIGGMDPRDIATRYSDDTRRDDDVATRDDDVTRRDDDVTTGYGDVSAARNDDEEEDNYRIPQDVIKRDDGGGDDADPGTHADIITGDEDEERGDTSHRDDVIARNGEPMISPTRTTSEGDDGDEPIGRHNRAFSESREEIGMQSGHRSARHRGGENQSYEPDSPGNVPGVGVAGDEHDRWSALVDPATLPLQTSSRKPSEDTINRRAGSSSREDGVSAEDVGGAKGARRGAGERGTASAAYAADRNACIISISVTTRPGRDERTNTLHQRDSFQSVTERAVDATPEDFDTFDTQAIKEARKEHTTFTDLVRKLSQRCLTQLQKVRALFRWITVKDLNRIDVDQRVDSDTPMGLLRGIKLGTESYHTLFKRLCSYAGLRCVIIDGFSKGAGYRPGARFHGNAFRNQWTAVSVDDTWRFINCNWGARHVRASRASELVYACDEFYFLTDPEDHIYQHFPDDADWQLLHEPISLDEFTRLPFLKSPFFNNYLAFADRYESTMAAVDGFAEVRLLVPDTIGVDARLKSRRNRVSSDVLKERILIRRIDAEVIFTVCLPEAGQYILEIFVASQWAAETMDSACSLRLECGETTVGLAGISYPPVACFGRLALWTELGLAEVSHADPYVEQAGTEVKLVVSAPARVRFAHTLRRWKTRDRAFKDFGRHALLAARDDHSATYRVRCPERGLYVLKLYASTGSDASELECVYNYLVHCRRPAPDARPMPTSSRRWQHCRLVAPLTGDLRTNTGVGFAVESTRALAIAVTVNGGRWKLLQRADDGLWQGTIATGGEPGKLSVYGQFDAERRKYIPLLEYRIVDD